MSTPFDCEMALTITVDDDVVVLLKPGNEAEIRAQAGSRGEVRFSYPEADQASFGWMDRFCGLGEWLELMHDEGRFLSGLAERLWQDEFDRQYNYTQLAIALEYGQFGAAADIMVKLYGAPTEGEFYEAVNEIRDQARVAAEEPEIPDLVREVACDVMAKLEPLADVPVIPTEPLPPLDLVERLRDWYLPIMEPLWQQANGLSLPDECDANEIGRLFSLLLNGTGIAVEVTDEVTAVMFQARRQRVAIPPQREMTCNKLLKTVLPHEWVHIQRYLNGMESGLALAAYGLPGYLEFEEGLATAAASVVGAKKLATAVKSYARPEAMVAIGLAAGLHQNKPWSFWSIFELFNAHYRLDRLLLQKELDDSKARESAEHQAMTRVIRTFRGTPGSAASNFGDKPLFCPRDLSYRKGNHTFWGWAAENPGRFGLLLKAKADLTNPSHLEFVESIG